MERKICCIHACDVEREVKALLDDIRFRIHQTIPVLLPHDSVAGYEVFVFVLSPAALTDSRLERRLKEVSDLNRIFLPVIIGGNSFTNWLLKKRYKGPNLRAGFYTLQKEEHRLRFYAQLMSYAGAVVTGDTFGQIFRFSSGVACKLLRNNEVIAELPGGGKSQDVTLFCGEHALKFVCDSLKCTKELTLSVGHIDNSDLRTIDVKFCSDVILFSNINYAVYDDNALIAELVANTSAMVYLPPGRHKLRFIHPLHKNLNRYIEVTIKPDEAKRITCIVPRKPYAEIL